LRIRIWHVYWSVCYQHNNCISRDNPDSWIKELS